MKDNVYSRVFIHITALLCIILALTVMCGWLLHMPRLVQLTPQSVPIHFNTALIFFLFGIALFCLSYNRFLHPTFVLGLIIACLGALTFSQDIFSFNAGIDEFFINDYIRVKTPSPGRMSPNTAVPFLLEGIFILLLTIQTKSKWLLFIAKIIGILVFSFGAISLFGYLLNIETAYAWGHLTQMSLPSSIALSLSGISIILISLAQARAAKILVVGFYPFLAGILFFFQSVLLSFAIEADQTKHVREFINVQTIGVKNTVINSFEEQGHTLQRKVARWEIREKTPYSEWLIDAQNTINDQPGWQDIVLTDGNLKIKWVAPHTLHDKLFDKSLIEDANSLKSINSAIATHTLSMIYIPVSAREDRLILSCPMFKNKAFNGVEAVEINPRIFFERLLNQWITSGYFINVVINGKTIFSSSNKALACFDYEKTEALTVYGLPYTIQVCITDALLHEIAFSKAFFWVLGIGIVLSVLLALYVQEFQKTKIHLREVEKNEERFRLVSKATNDILWDWNIQNNEFHISNNIKLLGYKPHAMTYNRKWWFEHVHPEDQNELHASIQANLSHHSPLWTQKYRFIRSDGTYANILDKAYILYTDEGAPLRAIGAMMDVTEQKAIEQRKNEFISTVSHELRTPLTSIKGSLGLLLAHSAGTLSEKAIQLLTISANNCDRLVRLISNILDIEKIESNKVEFACKPLDIVELARNAVQTNDTYAKTGIRLLFSPQISQATVFANYDRLHQVMDNLLSNAIKFSPQGTTITISIERIKDTIRVSVSDEGEGIPIEFQKRIFNKFARADSATVRLQGGTGLGLSISKAIIERQGGSIGFFAREPKGTTFYFELPEMKGEESIKNGKSKQASKSNLRILIVEDDRDFAHVLQLLLEKEGAVIDIAYTASQAKEFTSSNTYDLLTLDLALPDQDGISLAHELRQAEKTKTLPILVISYTGAETEQMLRKKPFSVITCLDKPFSLNELKVIIEKVPRGHDALTGPIRILHVEDEKDVLDVVKALLEKDSVIEQAMTVKEAKKKLNEAHFDLVLLDIRLPDGSGLSLLPCKDYKTGEVIPTIIFSASETPMEYMHFVTLSLLKSEVSNDKLLQTVRNILQKGRTQ